MDLSKLTPAPWQADYQPALWRVISQSEDTVVTAMLDEPDAEFIALARNAFDVMMRRGWWPSWEEDGDWRLDEPGDVCTELGEWVRANPFPDPFTALVEADKWYREHVEATPTSPAASSTPVPQSS